MENKPHAHNGYMSAVVITARNGSVSVLSLSHHPSLAGPLLLPTHPWKDPETQMSVGPRSTAAPQHLS